MYRVKNTPTLHELEVTPVTKKTQRFGNVWEEHAQRMESGRLSKEVLEYMPAGKRRNGRPMKKWSDRIDLQ